MITALAVAYVLNTAPNQQITENAIVRRAIYEQQLKKEELAELKRKRESVRSKLKNLGSF